MRYVLLAFSTLVSIGMVADQADAQAPASGGDIVVTGQRLEATAAALQRCIERNCPTDEDARATLAHAENLVVAGQYKDARRILTASLGRNKGEAARYPVPVADLYRASSRVAVSLGEGDAFRINAIDSLDALKAGLPANDWRVLGQRIEVGDTFARIGRVKAAYDAYAAVDRAARAAGLPVIAATARLRTAMLYSRVVDGDRAGSADRARVVRYFDALAKEPAPELAQIAYVARVLKARFLARGGDPTAIDALIAEMRRSGGTVRPVLLTGTPVELDNPVIAFRSDTAPFGPGPRSTTNRLPMQSFDGQWVDVAFWVREDGRVEDAEVVRQSEKLAGSWSAKVVASVQSRRYAPLKLVGGSPGQLRLERYTYTAFYDNQPSYTRIRTREPEARVDMLDLTLDPQVAAAEPSPTRG